MRHLTALPLQAATGALIFLSLTLSAVQAQPVKPKPAVSKPPISKPAAPKVGPKMEIIKPATVLSRIESYETIIIEDRNRFEALYGASNIDKTVYDYLISRSTSTEVLPKIQKDIQLIRTTWKAIDTGFFQSTLEVFQQSRLYLQKNGTVTPKDMAYMEDGMTLWEMRSKTLNELFGSQMDILDKIADRERDNQRMDATLHDSYFPPDAYYREVLERQTVQNNASLEIYRKAFNILSEIPVKNYQKPPFSALGATQPVVLAASDISLAKLVQRQNQAKALRKEYLQERDRIAPQLQARQVEYDKLKKQLAELEHQLLQRFDNNPPVTKGNKQAKNEKEAEKPDSPVVIELKTRIKTLEDEIFTASKSGKAAENLPRFKQLAELKAQLEKETAKKRTKPQPPDSTGIPTVQALEAQMATLTEQKTAVQRELESLQQQLNDTEQRLNRLPALPSENTTSRSGG